MVAADSVCGRIDDAATAEFMPMATTFSPAQLERFRREAKKLGRDLTISHTEALDRIAARYSFQNWSLLSKHSQPPAPPRPVRAAPLLPSTRYYLHGDLVVDDPTRCYCVRCDLFVELSHFEGNSDHDDGQDCERYLASLARHNALPRTRKAARNRPDDAPNVLAARAIAERDAYEASRAPFHQWLESQRGRNDMVGHLAVDILGDKTFPVSATTRRQVEEHLSWHGDHIVRVIRAAWRDFTTQKMGAQQ